MPKHRTTVFLLTLLLARQDEQHPGRRHYHVGDPGPATRLVFDDLWEQIEAEDKSKPGDNK